MELIGRRFGHIRVTDVVGQGGMGAVYKAADRELGRPVALKVIRDSMLHDADGDGVALLPASDLEWVDHLDDAAMARQLKPFV